MLGVDNGMFAREDNSRKAVEGLEYQNVLGNLGNGLSVKGLHSTVYATLFSHLVFRTGGVWWNYILG